jgi:phospholipid transport system substrate-binding protein
MLRIQKFLISILFACCLSTSAFANTKEVADFINDLSHKVIDIIEQNISESEKEAMLGGVFISHVDTPWIGKFAMGKYWRTVPKDQQKAFLNLYSNYLTELYVPNFRKYTGNVIKIINSKEVRPKEYLVETTLTDKTNSLNIKLDFRLIEKNQGKFFIYDIIAEGVSLITTQRSELNSIMAKEDFNSLIRLLVQKTSKK